MRYKRNISVHLTPFLKKRLPHTAYNMQIFLTLVISFVRRFWSGAFLLFCQRDNALLTFAVQSSTNTFWLRGLLLVVIRGLCHPSLLDKMCCSVSVTPVPWSKARVEFWGKEGYQIRKSAKQVTACMQLSCMPKQYISLWIICLC